MLSSGVNQNGTRGPPTNLGEVETTDNREREIYIQFRFITLYRNSI